MILARLQFPVAQYQRVIELASAADGVDKQRHGDAMQFGIGRIKQGQAMLAEDAGVELGVGVREGLAFGIAFEQIVGGLGVAEQLSGLRDKIFWFPARSEGLRPARPRFPPLTR